MTDTTDRLPWEDEPELPEPRPLTDEEHAAEHADDEPAADRPSPTAVALVASHSLRDLLDVRDPAEIQVGVSAIREELTTAIRELAAFARADRPDTIASPTDLRAEATRIADALDVLTGISGAFASAADVGRALACDLIDDLPVRKNDEGETIRPKSLRVADGHGWDLVCKREARSELSVDNDKLDDVLVSAAEPVSDRDAVSYVIGFRAGIEALRSVLGASPTYRSTALDGLVRDLEDAGKDELAKRARAAFGKVDKGEPRAKVERVEPSKRGRR